MNKQIFISLVAISILLPSCSAKRDVVDFDNACGGKPNRTVAVAGYISNTTATCSSNSGPRRCSFSLTEPDGARTIFFTLEEGKGRNQVQIPEADTQPKSVSTFNKDVLQIRGDKGNVLDLEKRVVLSGKTTLLVSSSMAPVCTLDEAEIAQF